MCCGIMAKLESFIMLGRRVNAVLASFPNRSMEAIVHTTCMRKEILDLLSTTCNAFKHT